MASIEPTTSQESDICQPEEMDLILCNSDIVEIVNAMSKTAVPVAHPTGELPARDKWPGFHKFEVEVDMRGKHKKSYVVSSKLNKIFVDIEKVVPFQVKWDGTPHLFLRALMVFTQADHMTMPVLRCPMHRLQQNDKHSDHVLATENDNAQYLMDPASKRRSVRVPLYMQLGCDHSLVNYKFMCKTSCTGGLNRCLTDIIFTLEDHSGVVLGRQNIGVKICSCPKRDKERDEGEEVDPLEKRKRKKDETAKSSIKKLKQEVDSLCTHPQASFMVTAASPEIAQAAKEHLRMWSAVKSIEFGHKAPINVVDDIAVLYQPYI